MARLQLNKSSLAREERSLQSFERFLPSLDLKRQHLMAEKAKAEAELANINREITTLVHNLGNKIPMLADTDIDLHELVKVRQAHIIDENVVGTYLPKLEGIEVELAGYSKMAKPHWVDAVVSALHDNLALQIKLRVQQQRIARLNQAVKTVTQRVNLFDKVLIPKTKKNIKTIKIYLSDDQMAAVVRSKIAKRKRAQTANTSEARQ